LTFSERAQKDGKLLIREKSSAKVRELLEILENDPLQNPPPYEKLRGELEGMYPRRINVRHRMLYELREYDGNEYKGVVHIVAMRTHYGGMPSFLFV
jgi:Txe/YoeB family toxin of toxin-antitoxin system